MSSDAAAPGPGRRPVEIEGTTLRVGGEAARFDAADPSSLLTVYLVTVRKLRRQRREPAIVLRSDDVVALSSFLGVTGGEVIDRLGALMGATRAQRAAMATLFATGALVIGLATAAVAAHQPGGGVAGSTGDDPSAEAVVTDLYDSLGIVVFADDETASADAPTTTAPGATDPDPGPVVADAPAVSPTPTPTPTAAPTRPSTGSSADTRRDEPTAPTTAPATTSLATSAPKPPPADDSIDDPSPVSTHVELGPPPTPAPTTTVPAPSTAPATDPPVDEVFEEPWLVIDPIVEPPPGASLPGPAD